MPLQATPPDRPNILLMMAEDMGPRVGAFGDPVAITPNLDALAAQGVIYPNTFTTAGVCAPSRAAHILGVHQIATGAQHMRTGSSPHGAYRAVPPPHMKAYPELLRASGYYTYTDNKLDYQFSGPWWNTGPFTIWDDEGLSVGWENRAKGQPFFGFVNFGVTHESGVFRPLGAWPHSTTHFVMQVLRALQSPDVEPAGEVSTADIALPPYFPDTPTVRADMARHYNNIAIMDAQVGALLSRLEADGLADSTIVIWTTDHGDGLPRGKRELYDSGIRVPMIIRWPPAYRPPGVTLGGVETRLVSFVDLAPTILRIAGVEAPSHLHGSDFYGPARRQYIYASRDRVDEVDDRQRAIRDARFKYIRSWRPERPGGHPLAFRDNIDMMRELRALYERGALNAEQSRWFEAPGEQRLFDTLRDPCELYDLSTDPAYAAVLSRMSRALDAWLAETGDASNESEADMMARFAPGGDMPQTPAPVPTRADGAIVLTATEGASIGYRIGEEPWRLYTGPVPARPGTQLHAKAVRYGWKESEEVEAMPP